MAYLAIRGSGAVNGVSRLHGEVSRRLFEPLFPRWPEDEVPVGHVTNGVHMPTWDSAAADELWTEACGKDRWLGTDGTPGAGHRRVSDARLWQFRTASQQVSGRVRARAVVRQLAASGASPEAIGGGKASVRSQRTDAGLCAPLRHLQAAQPAAARSGAAAAPADQPAAPGAAHHRRQGPSGRPGGQALIQEWMRFIRRPEARPHVVFLSDYDMLLTEHLVQGVDVWINTPRRPWEASGTSGMKVLVNGGLNLSELDGWWAEAYTPEVGLGAGRRPGARRRSRLGRRRGRGALRAAGTRGDPRVLRPRRTGHPHGLGRADAREHGAADAALFRQPHRARIHRAALPAGCRRLPWARGQYCAIGKQMVHWQQIEKKWPTLRFGEVKVEQRVRPARI